MNKMRLLIAAGGISLLPACAPSITPDPGFPPCGGQEVILEDYYSPLSCDLQPPQVLSYFMDDPGPVQEEECRRVGGYLAYYDEREVCRNIGF